MKFNSLHFGKAISAAWFVLLLVVVGMKNALAQTQVATLQHGDDVSVFYGSNAFVDAYNAAESADIITLSGGSFVGTNIQKSLTLRGAGCSSDTLTNQNQTIIPTSIQLNIADSSSLVIEGICFTGTVRFNKLFYPTFIKCVFYKIESYNQYNSSINYASFTNCIIHFFDRTKADNTSLINSVIFELTGSSSTILSSNNSIIRFKGTTYPADLLCNNSIIIINSINNNSSTCVYYNCIGIYTGSGNYGIFDYQTNNTNTQFTSYLPVFESFNGVFSYDETYLLKEDIVNNYIGNDGTQIGIYGGLMPYNPRPSYMIMKRCNVANRSTIDGKLSVDIEVITEGE